MAHFEFGQDRLALPDPLHVFELAFRSVDAAFDVCFIAQQMMWLR